MYHKYIDCICDHPGHTIRFSWFEDDDFVYVCTFLNAQGFWQRLWIGIKYIFGCSSKYGHFDETMLSKQQITEIRDLCSEWILREKDEQYGQSI